MWQVMYRYTKRSRRWFCFAIGHDEWDAMIRAAELRLDHSSWDVRVAFEAL